MSYRHRVFPFVLIGMTIVAFPSWGAGNAEDTASLQSQAIHFYQDGRLDEALPLYQRLAQRRPNDVYILKNLMWILWKTGDAEGTADVAARVAARQPDDLETWNLLGQANEAAHRWPEAIRAYKKQSLLEPQRVDVRLSLARLYLNIKEYDAAVAALNDVLKRKPNSPDALAALANINFIKGDYDTALLHWRKALVVEPGNVRFQFEEAKTLYYAGMPDSAIAQMKRLFSAQPDYLAVADFLTDDALANGNLNFARELLNGRLTDFREQDEIRLMQLTDVLQSRGEWDQSIPVLKRDLNVNANNGQPLLRMGDVLNHIHRSTEAISYYQQVLDKNPSSLRAMVGLSDTYINLHHLDKALEIFRQARQLDPTNPTTILRMAQTLYDAHQYEESRKLLTDWVSQQDKVVLPVLLYHGLTPFQRDPLLAYAVHMSTAAFEEQMKALHKAGYTAVTVQQVHDWYATHTPLPKHPILLAFDDARVDSFHYASPILQKYGLRATMFVPTREVDENLAATASWEELKSYQQSAQWEIQSHGDRAHDHIQIDADGRHGIFLANRIWLPKEKQLESIAAWRSRIDADHERSILKLKDHLGVSAIALAWPEGEYGEDSIPNSPEAVQINLDMAHRHFALAFQQDEYGLNVQSRDPMLISRLQPTRLSGKELVRTLRENNPVALAHRYLLQHAVWENRTEEANQWLAALKQDDVDESVLLVEKARVRKAGGEDEEAVQLAREAVTMEDSADNRRFLAEMLAQKSRGWTAGTVYQTDNQHRKNFVFEQSLDVARTGKFLWGLTQHYGRLLELGAPSVTDIGGGASITWAPITRQQFQLRSDWHHYVQPLKGDYSIQGRWDAHWSPHWSSQLEGATLPYDTAAAVDAGIQDRFGRATLQWQDAQAWQVGLSGAGHALSDSNSRTTGSVEISRTLFWKPLSVVERSSLDHMDKISPLYYSPQHLQTHQMGLDFSQTFNQNYRLRLRYLPGVGKESTTSWDFIQEASANLSIPIGRLTVEPTYSYYMTPTYRAHSYFVSLGFPF